MQIFHDLLGRIAQTLDRHRIPYMIIGGQAVLQYGRPRLTEDIDVTLGVDNSSLEVVRRAFDEASLKPRVMDVPGMVMRTNVLPLIDAETGVKVDCIFSFIEYEQQAIRRGKNVQIGGRMVKFAAVEDVVIHKLIAGRPRDREDLVGILNNTGNSMNREYLLRWLDDFSETLSRNLRTELGSIEQSLKK